MPRNVYSWTLWSSWSRECSQDIVKCLQYGVKVLKGDHLQWLCSLSSCIALNLKYSTDTLPRVAKIPNLGTLCLESICLRQVVSYSCHLYQVFDNVESVKEAVDLFKCELPTGKLLPTLSHEPTNAFLLTKEGNDGFSLVSIVDWFQRSHIIPKLQVMLDLKPINALVRGIHRELDRDDLTQEMYLREVDSHSDKAIHVL